MSQGRLQITEDSNVTVATFLEAAMLDESSIQQLGSELEKVVQSKEGIKLVVDLSNVDYVSSAVLGRLVKIYKLVKQISGKMKLAGVKNNILQVFKITKLDKMFEIHPTRDKAVKSFRSFFKS